MIILTFIILGSHFVLSLDFFWWCTMKNSQFFVWNIKCKITQNWLKNPHNPPISQPCKFSLSKNCSLKFPNLVTEIFCPLKFNHECLLSPCKKMPKIVNQILTYFPQQITHFPPFSSHCTKKKLLFFIGCKGVRTCTLKKNISAD